MVRSQEKMKSHDRKIASAEIQAKAQKFFDMVNDDSSYSDNVSKKSSRSLGLNNSKKMVE